jgi:hypothetical protein
MAVILASVPKKKTKFKICRVVVYSFVQMVTKQKFGVYADVHMVTKLKFGMYADVNGEKAPHILLHVMLQYCGCRLFHICHRFGTLVL